MAQPILLGHRGARASRHIPENTLASFELCLEHGCDGFEFDVRRSADGQAVICHDAVIRGMNIARTPAAKLELPALDDVLRNFATRAFLDVELKVAGLEQQTIAALHQHRPQKGYVVSSFLPEVLTAVHALDASTPLGLLCERRAKLRRWRESPAEWIIPHMELVDRQLIDQVHSSRQKIMVWTVNSAAQMRQLAEWGVDAIISDETDLAVHVLSPS